MPDEMQDTRLYDLLRAVGFVVAFGGGLAFLGFLGWLTDGWIALPILIGFLILIVFIELRETRASRIRCEQHCAACGIGCLSGLTGCVCEDRPQCQHRKREGS
jgi:hypothetical protein